MPQARGAANWLTNVRREAPKRRVWIDQSDEHILNNEVEKQKEVKIDQLSLQQHRSLADTQFEVQETKRRADDYNRMQKLLRNNTVDDVMKRRQSTIPPHMLRQKHDVSTSPGAHFLLFTAQGRTITAKGLTPKMAAGGEKVSQGFSHVSVEDSDSEEEAQRIMGKVIGVSAEPVRVKPRSGKPRIRRPRTSYLPGRTVRQIREAVHAEFTQPGSGKPRPKSSTGVRCEQDEEETEGYDPLLGGRSFQELRRVSHIDKLVSAEKEAQTRQKEQRLAERRQEEDAVIQQKLDKFYQRIDDFNKKSKKTVFNSFL